VRKATLRDDPNLMDPNRRNLLDAIDLYPQQREMTPVVTEMYNRYKEKLENKKNLKRLNCTRFSMRENAHNRDWMTTQSKFQIKSTGLIPLSDANDTDGSIVNITMNKEKESSDYQINQFDTWTRRAAPNHNHRI
jgi:hypothetical protein